MFPLEITPVGDIHGLPESPAFSAHNQVYNNALKNIYCVKPFAEAVQDRSLWGRLFESAIGAHIMSFAYEGDYKVYYWRTKPGCEVDYVLEKKGRIIGSRRRSHLESDGSWPGW